MSAYIYQITNVVTNNRYIGKTINPINDRFKRHIKNAFKGGQTKLYYEIREHGVDNFKVELVEETTKELLNSREIYYIETLKPELNGTPGGDGGSTTYGKRWITNGRDNKYIIDDVIPEGWKLGRTCKFSDPIFQKEMNSRTNRKTDIAKRTAYNMGKSNSKKTIINGIEYESRNDAMRKLNLTKHGLYKLLNEIDS